MTAGSAGKASRFARAWPVALIVAALLLALTGPFLGLLTSALGVALLVLFIVSRQRWGVWFVPLVASSVVVVLAGGLGLLLGLDFGATELQTGTVQTEGTVPR